MSDQPPPYAGGYAGTPLGAATGSQPVAAYAPPQAPREPGKRPGTVTAAGIVTIVFSVLAALGCALAIVGILSSRERVLDLVRDDQQLDAYSADAILTGVVVGVVVLLVWSLVAVVVAVLAMRRSSVSRILLVVSAAGTALFSLIAILSIISLVTLVAGLAVIVLLFTGGANQWYAGSAPAPPGPPPLAG